MAGPGNVFQKASVTHSLDVCCTPPELILEYNGAKNIQTNAMIGTIRKARERSGRTRTLRRRNIQAQPSCTAKKWHAHPQKKRPNNNVLAMATPRTISPGLITFSRANLLASDGSSGAKLLPVSSQCAMCASSKTCTKTKTKARRRELRRRRA